MKRSGDLAAVIVNYRTAALTSKAIAALERTAGNALGAIVIVENGSGEAELLRSRHPNARVVGLADNRGFAAGANAGIAACAEPYVLLLNPDTEVRPGAVEALRARLDRDPDIGVCAPVLLGREGEVRLDSYDRLPSLRSLFVGACFPLGHLLAGSRLHPELRPRSRSAAGGSVARVDGSAMALRREAWERAGPLDESFFMYFEEVEWQQRVRAAGFRIEIVPEARVVHEIQGGAVRETWPDSYLRSAFRYHQLRGRSPRTVGAVVRAGFAGSRLALGLARLVPRLREKARRMDAGYRRLAVLAGQLARERPGSASHSSAGTARSNSSSPT